MRRVTILVVSMVVLWTANTDAQTGLGYVADLSWQYQSWLGLGVGATIAPYITLSLSGGLTWGFLSKGEPVLPGAEWATSASYRFKEKNSTLYLFTGYRKMSGNGSANFVEAGIGYDPPDSIFEAYPEFSVLLPLGHQTSWLPGSMGSTRQPMKIPIIVKVTIKLYFNPKIPPFWENAGKN